MPLILGTSIISPLNVLVALSVYSFSLMVRSGVDASTPYPIACTNLHAPSDTRPDRR